MFAYMIGKRDTYLHQNEMEEMRDKAEELAEINPIVLPKDSRFLLEMDEHKSINGTYNNLDYWIRAVEAAKIAGRRTVNKNKIKRKHDQNVNVKEMRMERLGVRRVKREIERDMKKRAEIDGRSRSNKGQKNKKNEENTERSRNRRDKGHSPGD